MSRTQYGPWDWKKGLVLGVLMALSSSQAQADQRPASPPTATPPVIQLEENLLSVKLTQHTLAEVLTALEKVMSLRVYYRGSQIAALRDTKISMSYAKEPLLVGIRRLLEGQNYMINYAPGADAANEKQVLNIWFLSGTGSFSLLTSEAETTAEETAEDPSVATLIQTALTATDDEKRWDALEELINIDNFAQNPEIVQALWTALRQDQDPDMRRSALDGLEEVADADAPFEALATVFHTDQDEGVRAWALNVLVQKYGLASKDLVQQALQESGGIVTSYARNLQRQLEELETKQSQSSPPASTQQ